MASMPYVPQCAGVGLELPYLGGFPVMSDHLAAPSSADELVAYIVSLVDERDRTSQKASDGALLAEKIRRRYPELRYEEVGLVKLADAITRAESEGLLTRNRRVKHLEVLPAGAEEAADSIAA